MRAVWTVRLSDNLYSFIKIYLPQEHTFLCLYSPISGTTGVLTKPKQTNTLSEEPQD